MSVSPVSTLSDDTVVIPPTSETAIMPPLDLDYEDPESAQAETILYPCGTVALGQYEPCAHSQVQVLCCTCAGCSHDVWACGRELPRPRWDYYEAAFIGRAFGTNLALILAAVAVIGFLCTEIPYWILFIWWFLFCCGIYEFATVISNVATGIF